MEMKREILGNAPWRIDSLEEKRLGALADTDENAKREYVRFYQDNCPEYHKKGLAMLQAAIDMFRPGITEEKRAFYVNDMLYSLHRFGCMYDEYFLMGFEYLSASGRAEYVTDKNRWDYYYKLNGTSRDSLFKNKAETYELFKKFYGRDCLSVTSERDFDAFRKFRAKNRTFFVKPALGSGGKGIYLEDAADETDEQVFNRVLNVAPAIVESLIRQHPVFRNLHPNSVNTVRIPTVRYSDGSVKVFHPFLRIGVGTSVVDNAASGGIFAPVDPETGIVTQKGITESGVYYLKHPETGVVLPGFQIPDWDAAVALVKELADVIPECRYVGWDCALTEQGWIMVEGNLYGQFVDQFATKRGIKRELDALLEN